MRRLNLCSFFKLYYLAFTFVDELIMNLDSVEVTTQTTGLIVEFFIQLNLKTRWKLNLNKVQKRRKKSKLLAAFLHNSLMMPSFFNHIRRECKVSTSTRLTATADEGRVIRSRINGPSVKIVTTVWKNELSCLNVCFMQNAFFTSVPDTTNFCSIWSYFIDYRHTMCQV